MLVYILAEISLKLVWIINYLPTNTATAWPKLAIVVQNTYKMGKAILFCYMNCINSNSDMVLVVSNSYQGRFTTNFGRGYLYHPRK